MKTRIFLFVLSAASVCIAQNVRYDGIAQGPRGPVPNATVAFCSQPANVSTTPCSPLLAVCSSISDAVCSQPNPVTADSLGNFHAYIKISKVPFTVQVYGPQVAAPYVLVDQGSSSGGGSGGSGLGGVNFQTVNYTPLLTDCGKQISMSGANLILTLPNLPVNTTCSIFISNLDATSLTISRNGLTIDGAAANLTLGQFQGVQITTDGANYFTERGVTAGGSITGSPTNGTQVVGTGVNFVPQTKPQIDVRDGFGGSGGVDCTGVADSTAALQAMITNAPDYSSFLVPANCKIKVSGSPAITIDQRIGLQFVFNGRNGNNCNASGTASAGQIFYNQAYASGNRVFYINRSQSLEIRNMTINMNGGGDVGLDIDQVGGTPPINTRNDYYNVCIYNPAAANSAFKAVRISNTSTNNVENQHFYHLDVLCSNSAVSSSSSNGYAIWFGSSANLKNEIIDDSRSANCSGQISTQFGSDLTYQYGLDSSSFTDVTMGGFNDMLFGFRSENANHPVSIVNPTGPHTFIHNDWAAVTGPEVIDCPNPGCGTVVAIGNETDNGSTPWFNGHSGTGSLFATGNRFFNGNPLQWNNSWVFHSNTGGLGESGDNSWISSSLRITPPISGLGSVDLASPPLIFDTVNTGSTYDNFVVEAFGSGPPSAPTSQNFSTFYSGTNTSYLTLGAQAVDLKVGPNSSDTMTINTLAVRGTAGGTTWCYVVVPVTVNGHGAASTPATCTNTGNATLNSTNFNTILINPYSGAISYNIYRTTAGGTPNTTGKIGSVTPKFIIGGVSGFTGISFDDQGAAGDASSAPATNTTGLAVFGGQIQSTLTTGTAPLAIASTTPVANLTVSNHPTLQDCGSTTVCANTQKTAALIVRGSVAFPTATTVAVTSLPFTSASSYSCTAGDVTTAAGIINATTYTSGSSVTFTETGGVNTDTIRYICVGF